MSEARRRSLNVIRRRAKRVLETLTAGPAGLVPDDHVSFYYLAPGFDEHEWSEIDRDDFFNEDAPPGRYAFELDNGNGGRDREEGEKLEMRAREEREPNAMVAMNRAVSVLAHNAGAEVDRAAKRLREEEERHDRTRERGRLHEERVRVLEAEVARLQAELDADGGADGEVDRFASAIQDLVLRIVGVAEGQGTPEHVQAVQNIVEVIRRDPRAQRAVTKAGAGGSVQLLLGGG